MLAESFELGDTTIVFRVPETTAEVLHYRAFIASMDDLSRQIKSAVYWAASFVEEPIKLRTPSGLLDFLQSLDEEGGAAVPLTRLCNAIAKSAMMPDEMLTDLRTMLDRQNGIDPAWRPKSKCECPKCRRDEVEENPPGVSCLYDDISPVAIAVAAVAAGIGDGASQDPYYLTQLRSTVQRSTNRMMAHDREERERKAEEKAEWDEFRKANAHRVH